MTQEDKLVDLLDEFNIPHRRMGHHTTAETQIVIEKPQQSVTFYFDCGKYTGWRIN